VTDQTKQPAHTSVLYFHGMGEQRRYEEVSRLVDSLDQYAHGAEGEGILRKIVVRLEEGRGLRQSDVAYIRVMHSRRDGTSRVDGAVRFYECYWAPATAGGSSYRSVLSWLGRQLLTPISSLWSPWREKQRLRRSALRRLWDKSKKNSDPGDLRGLLDCYDDFEGWSARRAYPKGSFRDFLAFIDSRDAKKPQSKKRLIALARRWRRFYFRSELSTLFALLSICFAAGIALLLLIALALLVLKSAAAIAGATFTGTTLEYLQEKLAGSPGSVIGLLVLMASLLGVLPFLRNYMGDVQFWCTYEETDKKHEMRTKILQQATQMLSHVLEDKDCSRVVVVAHSLGTAIAHDAFLEVARHNKARNAANPIEGPMPLEKISHFITMGSPIDKIHYFFEHTGSKSHRYKRVVEALRGDIGTVPFSKNRHPFIHWINCWDIGDFVSSSLESPTNKHLANLCVDNVHQHSYRFPSPANHSGYFQSDGVMRIVSQCIFADRYRYVNSPANAGEKTKSAHIGPGSIMIVTRILRLLLLILPWVALVPLFAFALSYRELGIVGLWSAIGLLGVLGIAWIYSLLEGHLQPIAKHPAPADDLLADDGAEAEQDS